MAKRKRGSSSSRSSSKRSRASSSKKSSPKKAQATAAKTNPDKVVKHEASTPVSMSLGEDKTSVLPPPVLNGPDPEDAKTAAASPDHAYKPGTFSEGMLCLIKETTVVRNRHPGIHGCRCTVVEIPNHPNTWFQVQLHNPPASAKKSKYDDPIKVQATSLVPISKDGKPLPVDTPDRDDASEVASNSQAGKFSSSSSSPANSKAPSSVLANEAADEKSQQETPKNRDDYQNGSGSEAGTLLSNTEPVDHWIGRRVIIKGGKQSNAEAIVIGSGNGWVQMLCTFEDGTLEGPNGESPKECAKRAHELKCKDAAPHPFDDPSFKGGNLASTGKRKVSVIIASGRYKKRKGKVIGGGHGFYLVELRDGTTVLKTEEQLQVETEVLTGKESTASSSTRAADAQEGAGATKDASNSKSAKDSQNSSSSEAAVPATSTSIASSRPRRANAGVNKARTDPKYGSATSKHSRRNASAADGGDEDSDSDNTRAGPMTPAEKLAHRNKEKIKAKFRAVQNAVLKRSKRSTRGSRYSQSSKRHYSTVSEREREEEEARAHYEMQVESYQQRVQKYVENAIERERNEPRPDITSAMILLERDWKHDDLSDCEDTPTYEWEANDPEVYDLEPERCEWESMTSSVNAKAFHEDPETKRAIEIYSRKAKVRWLGVPGANSSNGGSVGEAPDAIASSICNVPVYNKSNDWQPCANDDDMCAYDYIQAQFRGGIHLFVPKSKPTKRNQFETKSTRLEPAPAYGNAL